MSITELIRGYAETDARKMPLETCKDKLRELDRELVRLYPTFDYLTTKSVREAADSAYKSVVAMERLQGKQEKEALLRIAKAIEAGQKRPPGVVRQMPQPPQQPPHQQAS